MTEFKWPNPDRVWASCRRQAEQISGRPGKWSVEQESRLEALKGWFEADSGIPDPQLENLSDSLSVDRTGEALLFWVLNGLIPGATLLSRESAS